MSAIREAAPRPPGAGRNAILRFLVNLVLLAVFSVVAMFGFLVIDQRPVDEPVVVNVLFTAFVYWQTFLIPAIAYLIVMERLPRGWSRLRRRAVAAA